MTVPQIDPATFRPAGAAVSRTEAAALRAVGLKWCSRCCAVKSLEDFRQDSGRPDGRRSRCRDCCRTTDSPLLSARREASALAAEGMKRCSACKEIKAAAEFQRDASRPDGMRSCCKHCAAARDAQKVADRREKWSAADPYDDPSPKRCRDCGRDLPRHDFHQNRCSSDGLGSSCVDCGAARAAEDRNRYRAKWAEGDAYADPSPKWCPGCGRARPRLSFSANRSAPDGLGSSCRDCAALEQAEIRTHRRETWSSAEANPYADPSPKRCPGCGLDRPRSDFTTVPSAPDGLASGCRGCISARLSGRRSRMLGTWVEDVDRGVLWARDGGTCYLCGDPADPARWDLEHIDPIANGGEHSYANTAVSHPSCNYSKGAKEWPDVSFDPDAVLTDPAPAYLRGVMLAYLPDGSVRLGPEVLTAADADAIDAAPVVPDADQADAV